MTRQDRTQSDPAALGRRERSGRSVDRVEKHNNHRASLSVGVDATFRPMPQFHDAFAAERHAFDVLRKAYWTRRRALRRFRHRLNHPHVIVALDRLRDAELVADDWHDIAKSELAEVWDDLSRQLIPLDGTIPATRYRTHTHEQSAAILDRLRHADALDH